jgi:transcription initiation factor IIE alpha subunit
MRQLTNVSNIQCIRDKSRFSLDEAAHSEHGLLFRCDIQPRSLEMDRPPYQFSKL